LRQTRGKVAVNYFLRRGKVAAIVAATARQSRGNAECRLPRVYREFATTFLAVLQKNFRGNTRGKLTFLL
jgi:hypothetical protein